MTTHSRARDRATELLTELCAVLETDVPRRGSPAFEEILELLADYADDLWVHPEKGVFGDLRE